MAHGEDRMTLKILVTSFLFGACFGLANAEVIQAGSCDNSLQRERKTLQFILESRNDTDSDFVAKAPCSDLVLTIRTCSIVGVRGHKVQHYCYLPDKPTYYEYVDQVD